MISFRYHIVSIVAVFLALALGIVIGTTALNGPITKDLRGQVNDLQQQRGQLAGQVKTLQTQVGDASQFASTYGTKLVSGTLPGKQVLVVTLPGTTPAMTGGVTQEIAAAGGTVVGQLSITQSYLDPGHGNDLRSFATGPVHPLGWVAPETDDPTALGGSLLAYVLLGKGKASDVKQVISAFVERHLLTVSHGSITPTKTVVVLGHGTLPADGYASQAQLALVDALATGGGNVVVAGDRTAAQGGGVIARLRDSKAKNDVSTVDDASSPLGQVSAVLALAGALHGESGHYGTAAGAQALFPTAPK